MKIFIFRNRTIFALAIGFAIGIGGITLAQHTGMSHVKTNDLSQREIIEKLNSKDTNVTMREVTFEPGQKDTPHRHTGPVFGYVLEGEYEHAMDNDPAKI
jgi:quercetin dioxygenase-like cupin family protein